MYIYTGNPLLPDSNGGSLARRATSQTSQNKWAANQFIVFFSTAHIKKSQVTYHERSDSWFHIYIYMMFSHVFYYFVSRMLRRRWSPTPQPGWRGGLRWCQGIRGIRRIRGGPVRPAVKNSPWGMMFRIQWIAWGCSLTKFAWVCTHTHIYIIYMI